jgi:hypothetical protein
MSTGPDCGAAPGLQRFLFDPVTSEPVDLDNPAPGSLRPRKWRLRLRKQKYGAPDFASGSPASTPPDPAPEIPTR